MVRRKMIEHGKEIEVLESTKSTREALRPC